jgi:hypothetical protein
MMRIEKQIILLLIFAVVFLSCEKEKLSLPVSYNGITSEVGPLGKTLHFYEKSSNIPDSLFPTLEIAPNTFTDRTIIKIFYEKILSGNIPEELTSISSNNTLWHFACNKQMLKPIVLTLPFQKPDNFQRLINYKYLFKLYRILPEKDTKVFSNWELVNTYVLDTTQNLFSTVIESFDFSYCVQFEEIKLEDACILSVDGYIKDVCSWGDNGYVKFGTASDQNNCFVCWNGVSSYDYTFKSKDVDVYIAFSFKGSTTGTYSGDNVKLKYYYSKNTQGNWKYKFTDAYLDTIKIYKYGNIGDHIKGNIKGRVRDSNSKEIQINMDFTFKRAR